MTPDDWQTGYAKSLGVFPNGDALPDPDRHGRRLSDDTFLLLFNAHYDEVSFLLPGEKMGQQWLTHVDTAASTGPQTPPAGAMVAVAPYGLQILRRV
jgi:isoamylase